MMFGEFYKEGATMDYPLGGGKAVVDVLVRAKCLSARASPSLVTRAIAAAGKSN